MNAIGRNSNPEISSSQLSWSTSWIVILGYKNVSEDVKQRAQHCAVTAACNNPDLLRRESSLSLSIVTVTEQTLTTGTCAKSSVPWQESRNRTSGIVRRITGTGYLVRTGSEAVRTSTYREQTGTENEKGYRQVHTSTY